MENQNEVTKVHQLSFIDWTIELAHQRLVSSITVQEWINAMYPAKER